MSAPDQDLTLNAKSHHPPNTIQNDSGLLIIDDSELLIIDGPSLDGFDTTTFTGFEILILILRDTNPGLKTLLGILRNNPMLKFVFLSVRGEPVPEAKPDLESRIELGRLEDLSLSFDRWNDVKYMISHIDIPAKEGIEVAVRCFSDVIPLNGALEFFGRFPGSPIHVEVESVGTSELSIALMSREKRKLVLKPVPSEHMCTALEGGYPLFPCENIETFHCNRKLAALSSFIRRS